MKLISFLFLLSLPFGTQAAVILKINHQQALIHLEGLKTKKGSYFEALDLNGKSGGLLQIKRVGNKKAIGILRLGKMGLKWSLEPKSKRWAINKIKRYRMALLQKQKLKRKALAQQKRKKRRLLAQNERRKVQRQIASYDQDHFVDDSQFAFHDENDYLSDEDSHSELSHQIKPANITIGLLPEGNFNLMKISPKKKDDILMKGFGFGGGFFLEALLKPFLSMGGYVGYRRFSVASDDRCSKNSRGCSLEINYITSGLNLKWNFLTTKSVQMSLGVLGNLLYPIEYINDAHLSRDSFGFHGTLGLGLGANLSFGNFVIPIQLSSSLVIPPTATTLTSASSLNIGLAYKF